MEIVNTIQRVRQLVAQARQAGKVIGLVPTMGALHAGHMSLINAAVEKCGFVVVSIFVNPAQFGPNEDFDKYPRTLQQDCQSCQDAGVDVIFAPAKQEMYPSDDANKTWVLIEKLTDNLCGKNRPGHFRGVTTVCTKLFNIIAADYAFFGQKDAQQAVVIKKMVRDLNIPLQIITCPIVREPDGLAMSSRNKYLDNEQRKQALCLYNALIAAEKLVKDGQKDSESILQNIRSIISQSKIAHLEYAEIVDPDTLKKISMIDRKALIAVAARIGSTRLIDNIIVDV
jgi:pantoate--beta-alanine ligase